MKDVEKLEKVQKFALRLCVKQWDLDYVSLLFICDLPTLTARRKYFNLCTMYIQDCKSTDLLSFKYVFSQSHSFPAIFKPSAILSDKLIFILQTLVLSGTRCLFL